MPKPACDPGINLSDHFRTGEFACKCGCGFGTCEEDVDEELLVVLERLRAHFGNVPVTITSGCRCLTHNRNVGSTDKSQHVQGTAADIVVTNASPSEVHSYLVATYPSQYGIGSYSTFTHVDVRDYKARW